MTYGEIISQVARRLGIDGFSTLKADLRYAVVWAESEISSEQKIVTRTERIDTVSGVSVYVLPQDYNEPKSVVFFSRDGAQIDSVEVGYDEWVKWNPSDTLPAALNDLLRSSGTAESFAQRARFANRIVFATRFDGSGYSMHIKPAIDGYFEITYSSSSDLDPYKNLDREPSVPSHLHQYIVYGAMSWMAQVMKAEAKRSRDWDAVMFYVEVERSSRQKFEEAKNKTKMNVNSRSQMPVLKAWNYYESPSRRRGRR